MNRRHSFVHISCYNQFELSDVPRQKLLPRICGFISSCSSEASVELYEQKLKSGIDANRKSQTHLQELANAADKIIDEEFAPDSRSIYTYKKDFKEISVGLDKVMIAMLACAEECGGESGRHYGASAILACSKEEDVVRALTALGTTWLTHFLFMSVLSCITVSKFSYFLQLKRLGATEISSINDILDLPLSTKWQNIFREE